jgi:hypothetical protein
VRSGYPTIIVCSFHMRLVLTAAWRCACRLDVRTTQLTDFASATVPVVAVASLHDELGVLPLYIVTATATLSGYMAATFDSNAQALFKAAMADVLDWPIQAINITQVTDAVSSRRRLLANSSLVRFSVDAPAQSSASALAANITAISPAALVSTLQSYGLTACTGVALSSPAVTSAVPPPPSTPATADDAGGLPRQVVLGIAIGVGAGGAACCCVMYFVWRHLRQARAGREAAAAVESFGASKAGAAPALVRRHLLQSCSAFQTRR